MVTDDSGSLSIKIPEHKFLNTSSFHEELVTLHTIISYYSELFLKNLFRNKKILIHWLTIEKP